MNIQAPFVVTAVAFRRLSTGVYFLGTFGTPAPVTPLSVLLRLLFLVAILFRVLPKRLLKRKGLGKVNIPPLTPSAANGIAVAHRQPTSGSSSETFRRIRIRPRIGARFESKRLMRMTHQHPLQKE
jgi:hypothetical protein